MTEKIDYERIAKDLATHIRRERLQDAINHLMAAREKLYAATGCHELGQQCEQLIVAAGKERNNY